MSAIPTGRAERLRKFARFVAIYGPSRTLFKAAGRLRLRLPGRTRSRVADVGLIGCGQFAFGTIGYFLQRNFGPRVAACYDVAELAARSLARSLRVRKVCASADEVFEADSVRLVYIASNHASHAEYATRALGRGLDVYVEKPIAVSLPQLTALLQAKRQAQGRIFAGYNRPLSGAIRDLRERVSIDPGGSITLECFISGHRLESNHWYREPGEGTRVCGNLGHWLDLFVHLLAWRSLPDRLHIAVTWADDEAPEDNLCVSIRTDCGDLLGLTFTSRCEPFEGVTEQINFQHNDSIARIDDFRCLTLWRGSRVQRIRYWPKDVGHERAILQPFRADLSRDWHEVELSTLLMLRIADMVRAQVRVSSFSFVQEWTRLSEALGPPPSSASPVHGG